MPMPEVTISGLWMQIHRTDATEPGSVSHGG